MLPYAVSGLLLLAIGAGRVVDAALIAGCTAKVIFELADRGGGNAGEKDAKRRREADDGGCVTGSLQVYCGCGVCGVRGVLSYACGYRGQ
jgi:hypothetical protein